MTTTTILLLAMVAQAEDDLAVRAAAIKPTAELEWLRVPWILNLADAQKVAREEKRPIFLWVAGDDPLERC